jgi:electron transfer flavoprotein alpha subunit
MAGIMVIAEILKGELKDITAEIIGSAIELKKELGGDLTIVTIGFDRAVDQIDLVNFPGVDEIITVDAEGCEFDPVVYEKIIVQLGSIIKPRLIMVGHTVNGMAYAPALATRLGCGFASDVIAMEVVENELIATRESYANKLNLELGFNGNRPVVVTLRSATFTPPEGSGNAKVTHSSINILDIAKSTTHIKYEAVEKSEGPDITKAEFLLAVGRGIQEKENLQRLSDITNKLNATLACSRPIVDSGWLNTNFQIGQSGKIAKNCKLYIALGISGAVQHLVGMKHVDTIIAVNKDPSAPIFNVATYGAVIDLLELTEALERQVT